MHSFKVLHVWHLLRKRLRNACQNQWILRSKIQGNPLKNVSKRRAFLVIDFSWIFGRFWLRFGGSWRGFVDLSGVQKGSQKAKLDVFDKIAIFNGFVEGLGWVWGGFWEGFGKALGNFWRILRGLGARWARLVLFAGFCMYFKHLLYFHIFLCIQATPSHVSHFPA